MHASAAILSVIGSPDLAASIMMFLSSPDLWVMWSLKPCAARNTRPIRRARATKGGEARIMQFAPLIAGGHLGNHLMSTFKCRRAQQDRQRTALATDTMGRWLWSTKYVATQGKKRATHLDVVLESASYGLLHLPKYRRVALARSVHDQSCLLVVTRHQGKACLRKIERQLLERCECMVCRIGV